MNINISQDHPLIANFEIKGLQHFSDFCTPISLLESLQNSLYSFSYAHGLQCYSKFRDTPANLELQFDWGKNKDLNLKFIQLKNQDEFRKAEAILKRLQYVMYKANSQMVRDIINEVQNLPNYNC